MKTPSRKWPTTHTTYVILFVLLAIFSTYISLHNLDQGLYDTDITFLNLLFMPAIFAILALLEAWREYKNNPC